MVPPQQAERRQPFVMVEPRIDREALRKLTRPAPLSDADREARSRERNPNATNNQPFLRGRSAELTEAQKRTEKPKGQGPAPDPAPPTPKPTPQAEPAQNAANTATPPPLAAGAPADAAAADSSRSPSSRRRPGAARRRAARSAKR